jgi:hypothetical protein
MARRRSQFCVRYPELFLALSVFPCAIAIKHFTVNLLSPKE